MFIANGVWSDKAVPLAFRPLTLKTTDQRPDISECVLVYISRKRIQNFRVRLIDKMGKNMVFNKSVSLAFLDERPN